MNKFAKRTLIVFCIVAICFISLVIIQTPFITILSLPNVVNLSSNDVKDIENFNEFGHFVNLKLSGNVETSVGCNPNYEIKVKLFNLITLKTLKVNNEDINIYAGGDIVGFSLNSEGVIVISTSKVESMQGQVDTLKNSNIQKGDVIKKIENSEIKSVADICRVTNKDDCKDKDLNVELCRNGETIFTTIKNTYDKNSRLYKLGLWVKDDASGIGTLTFVKEEDNRFGALGHAICDNDTKTVFDAKSGEMYKCSVIGLKKGVKGKAGEIKGLFLQGKNNLGTVEKNCECGVYGQFEDENYLNSNKEILKAGGRMYAKAGKAILRSAVDGKLKDYEIEIVKTNYQSTKNEKNMVIRVTDKELLEKTGGIIQGMSGSPIIQNGRIVGAVTHVFINDPTKGFGIYLDWMINQ